MKNKKNILEKSKNILKKIAIILSILLLNLFGFINSVNALNINSANITSLGDCGSLLIYKGIVVKAYYAQYENNGISYPAYCLNKTKQGVADGFSYSVSVQDAVQDVGLWKVIVNGYPYKTIEELGVANKEEAFTATKQAIYCYIHENRPEDYEPIGEAGQRTLNALKNIYTNAMNSNETKISSTVSIIRNSEKWEQDEINKNYLSKTYSVKAGAQISSYKINTECKDLANVKVTDENNKEKTDFAPNEKFKILVPIKSVKQDAEIKISVNANINTKPVLYGTAPDSNYQDYALTAATYEDGTGSINEKIYKNETKIIIIKTDSETKKVIEGVEFELLNENKNVVYTNLKTNKDGKIIINNVIPGTYYLKETKTLDGYIKNSDLLKINIKLNEEFTVKVDNSKEKAPTPEISKNEVSIKKLPVTGM